MRIILADTTNIDKYGEEVMQVLDAIGYPEALVTDESTVSDFDLDSEQLALSSRILGLSVKNEHYIWSLAERLYKLKELSA